MRMKPLGMVSALYKDDPERSLSFPPCEDRERKCWL